MKKKLFIYLLVLVLAFIFPINAIAAPTQSPQEVIRFEDGSYITITLSEAQDRASGTKSGSKTYRYYTDNGTEEWRAVLTGTFTYTGSSATCTASSCNVTIYNSAWYVVSKTATKSDNAAKASLTMGKKLLGITIVKKSAELSLSCSANGTLS